MLTPKQENYVQLLHKGLTQHQAYIDAGYNTEHQTNETLDNNASRLAKNVGVKARLVELQSQSRDDTIASVKERKEILTKIIRHEHTEVTPRDSILATAEVNKMEKVYETRPVIESKTLVINVIDSRTEKMVGNLIQRLTKGSQDEQETPSETKVIAIVEEVDDAI